MMYVPGSWVQYAFVWSSAGGLYVYVNGIAVQHANMESRDPITTDNQNLVLGTYGSVGLAC